MAADGNTHTQARGVVVCGVSKLTIFECHGLHMLGYLMSWRKRLRSAKQWPTCDPLGSCAALGGTRWRRSNFKMCREIILKGGGDVFLAITTARYHF